jgi:hypothetical protein
LKKVFYILLFAATCLSLSAQETEISPKKKKKAWNPSEYLQIYSLDNHLGLKTIGQRDSMLNNFANSTAENDYSILNASTGTMGAPLQSQIYFDQTRDDNFLFSLPYDAYFLSPERLPFFNTKVPYATLNYRCHGTGATAESDFDGIFSINANKNINVTGYINYMRGRGLYNSQATRRIRSGIWGYYNGKWYSANVRFMYHNFDADENGGIQKSEYLTNDSLRGNLDPVQIPINLTNEAKSRYKSHYVTYQQKVHLAHIKQEVDSGKYEYKPIASILHTFNWTQNQKRYRESTPAPSGFYPISYTKGLTLDSALYNSINNTIGFQVNEGFSKYFPLNFIAYIQHHYLQYGYLNEGKMHKQSENEFWVGATLSKETGKNLLFNATAEVYAFGSTPGDFHISADVSTAWDIQENDEITFYANAKFCGITPSFFEEKYISRYYSWENHFKQKIKTSASAKFLWTNKFVDLGVGVNFDNETNHVYFNTDSTNFSQHSAPIQILAGNIDFNIHANIFHLDNKVIYQWSSNQDIVPLPTLSMYNNLYFQFALFKKALKLQVGVDMYYNTAYFAPIYNPALGIFQTQGAKKEQVGNYPLLSAYLSAKIYTARIFVKYYHFNASFMNHNYFSMPKYPYYNDRIQFGVSWNFYD